MRPLYEDLFFRPFPAARSSHRAAIAGNRPAKDGIAPVYDTPLCTGNHSRPAGLTARAGGEPAASAAPARDGGSESIFRLTRRFQ